MTWFGAELPSIPVLIKNPPNEPLIPKKPPDPASNTEFSHLTFTLRIRDAATAQPMGAHLKQPEIDWEVGADKQLCSEEKEGKSQVLWLPLYHRASPRWSHSWKQSAMYPWNRAVLKFNALSPEGRSMEMGLYSFSARLPSVFMHFSEWVTRVCSTQ